MSTYVQLMWRLSRIYYRFTFSFFHLKFCVSAKNCVREATALGAIHVLELSTPILSENGTANKLAVLLDLKDTHRLRNRSVFE